MANVQLKDWSDSPHMDLHRAGVGWQMAKARERQRMEILYAAIVHYCESGGTESEAARVAGVDRMTVRRALGKR